MESAGGLSLSWLKLLESLLDSDELNVVASTGVVGPLSSFAFACDPFTSYSTLLVLFCGGVGSAARRSLVERIFLFLFLRRLLLFSFFPLAFSHVSLLSVC